MAVRDTLVESHHLTSIILRMLLTNPLIKQGQCRHPQCSGFRHENAPIGIYEYDTDAGAFILSLRRDVVLYENVQEINAIYFEFSI